MGLSDADSHAGFDFFQFGVEILDVVDGGAVEHGYAFEGVAAFDFVVHFSFFAPHRTFFDDAFVGFENGMFFAFRPADAEVGFVEMQTASSEGVVREIQYPFGVERLVLETHFEVQVRTRGAACAAAETYDFAGFDVLSRFDEDFGHVSVDGLESVAVPYHDEVAVAAHVPSDAYNAREAGPDGVARTQKDVHAAMRPLPPVAPSVGRGDDVLHREAEFAGVANEVDVDFVGQRVERQGTQSHQVA